MLLIGLLPGAIEFASCWLPLEPFLLGCEKSCILSFQIIPSVGDARIEPNLKCDNGKLLIFYKHQFSINLV